MRGIFRSKGDHFAGNAGNGDVGGCAVGGQATETAAQAQLPPLREAPGRFDDGLLGTCGPLGRRPELIDCFNASIGLRPAGATAQASVGSRSRVCI
jgi:hypothetical protein